MDFYVTIVMMAIFMFVMINADVLDFIETLSVKGHGYEYYVANDFVSFFLARATVYLFPFFVSQFKKTGSGAHD